VIDTLVDRGAAYVRLRGKNQETTREAKTKWKRIRSPARVPMAFIVVGDDYDQ